VGVSHQYTVEGPGGRELTVYAQNDGVESPPHPGERVRLLWRPEHTFVVDAGASDGVGAAEGEDEVDKEKTQ
jgi:spermidine/putrescine transport system ATP-binding protein